jgi:nicotinamide-nucleotide amidase
MKQRFAQLGLPLVDNAMRQVRSVQGARVYDNPTGLAPAFELRLEGATVICLPGPPRELCAIFDTHLRQRIAELRSERGDQIEHVARKIFRVFGRGESQIATALEGLSLGPGASLHYQVKFPEILVKLVVRGLQEETAHRELAVLCAEVRGRLGELIYGEDDSSIVRSLVHELIARGQTLATAESCTGGLIASMLTDVPGVSECFLGGAVTYSDSEKVRQLGVSQATLDAHGAVSEQVVLEMAAGVRDRVGSDWRRVGERYRGPGRWARGQAGGHRVDRRCRTRCVAILEEVPMDRWPRSSSASSPPIGLCIPYGDKCDYFLRAEPSPRHEE